MKLEDQKVFILGANGMLGSDLLLEAQRLLPKESIAAPGSKELNLSQNSKIFEFCRQFRPTVILNGAAYTNVDGAETEREKAYQANVLGPKSLVEACREFKSKLVHFSTDYVFSGAPGHIWTEEDTPVPPQPNYYAQTKLEGEKIVAQLSDSITLRVQWLYGKKKDKFLALKEKAVATPFVDQLGSPSWTREIARTVFKLLERDAAGLFHFAYDDSTSWLEVYQLVKERLSLSVELVPKRLSEVPLVAKRPLNCVMSNRKLCQALGVSSMGSWKTPFAEFLK